MPFMVNNDFSFSGWFYGGQSGAFWAVSLLRDKHSHDGL